MKKLYFICCVLSIAVSSSSFANSPIKIVNNTNNNLSYSSTFCSNKSKICNLIGEKTLHSKLSGDNLITLIAPLGQDQLIITRMTESAAETPNKIVASRSEPCKIPSSANVVIIDDFGTDQLFCHYAN